MNKSLRLQINREQLSWWHELVVYLLKEYPAEDRAEELIDALINKIRIKLRNRLETYNNRNSYSITLSQEEAMAYFIWAGQVTPMIPKGHFVFEQNTSQMIINQIDQTYGTINRARPTAGQIAGAN